MYVRHLPCRPRHHFLGQARPQPVLLEAALSRAKQLLFASQHSENNSLSQRNLFDIFRVNDCFQNKDYKNYKESLPCFVAKLWRFKSDFHIGSKKENLTLGLNLTSVFCDRDLPRVSQASALSSAQQHILAARFQAAVRRDAVR